MWRAVVEISEIQLSHPIRFLQYNGAYGSWLDAIVVRFIQHSCPPLDRLQQSRNGCSRQVNARNEADIVLLDDVVAVFRSGADVHLYVVSSPYESSLATIFFFFPWTQTCTFRCSAYRV